MVTRAGTAFGVVLAVLAAACSGGSTSGQQYDHPAPGVAVEAASPTALEVRWEAATNPHRWWVVLMAPDGRNVAQRTACGGCREVTVEHLAPGTAYDVTVVAKGADGSFGEFPTPTQGSTPPDPACEAVPDDEVCAAIASLEVVGEATGVGLGGLHGITSETDPGALAALESEAWRVSALDVERFGLARATGAAMTVLLSDPWITSVSSAAPWADWEEYETFVAGAAEAYVVSGALPDYWEVQNEPSDGIFESGDPPTVDLVVEQHRRAAALIRQRVPDAAVVGPAAAYPTFGFGVADLERFAALTADGTLTALSWHEIGAGCLGDCDGGPRAVLQHADDARAALAELGDPDAELHVNEWGAPWNYLQPGAIAGYLSALAFSGVDVANTTCWPVPNASGESELSCFARPGTLAGRLLPDGRTPTDAWWAHVAYAQMTGPGFGLLAGTVADPHASIVTTIDRAGVIRALLGRHSGCQEGVDANCPEGVTYADDEEFTLVVPVAADAPAYAVAVDRIRSTAGASTGPEPVDRSVAQPEGGQLRLGPWTVADGDAMVVTLAPTA